MALRHCAHALGAAAILAGLLGAPRAAHADTDCDSLPNPVYVSGSSASKPFLIALGAALSQASDPITVVYYGSNATSCTGVNSQLTPQVVSNSLTYWVQAEGGTVVQGTCSSTAGKAIQVGISDVFPTSCPDVTYDDLTAASLADFHGPTQAMTFVAPTHASQVVSISAEAAYLTMGRSTKLAELPWSNPTKIVIRNQTSGTQTMLGKAIRLPAAAWIGTDAGSSSGVLQSMSSNDGAANPQEAIGILAESDVYAPDLTTGQVQSSVKILAFQPWGQSCAFLPDSSPTLHDLANVRNGSYEVFGPLHFVTKVDTTGVPTDPAVAKLIRYITLADPVPGNANAVIDTAISRLDVPQCAMKVTRDGEVGDSPLKAYTPTKPCHCYFDSKVTTTTCATCNDAHPCAVGTCNYGYCEVP